MNRDEFIVHLRAGKPATEAVFAITGRNPYIVTIADFYANQDQYIRYGVMMAGDLMAALVILQLDGESVPAALMSRIRAGEPTGAVLTGLKRRGYVTPYPRAIRARAALYLKATYVGRAEEIFTESLFK